MNNKITELKQAAGIDYNPDQEGLDLFADLIIEECIATVQRRCVGDHNREDAEVLRCVADLKEHFGVKE